MNKVMLVGRLVRDPEFKILNNGMKATNLSIAVNRRFKDKNGEWREATDFFDIETYGSTAERAAQLGKGYQVVIEGVLRQDKWTSPSGEKRSKVKIIANKVRLLSKPKTSTAKTEKENLLEEEVAF